MLRQNCDKKGERCGDYDRKEWILPSDFNGAQIIADDDSALMHLYKN
jgi:hypothetical protein